jgi:hypothetical protein
VRLVASLRRFNVGEDCPKRGVSRRGGQQRTHTSPGCARARARGERAVATPRIPPPPPRSLPLPPRLDSRLNRSIAHSSNSSTVISSIGGS